MRTILFGFRIRRFRFGNLLFALACAALLPAAEKEGSLTGVGRMHELRGSHTATLLRNGKVLVAGGFKKDRTYSQIYFKSAELFNPRTQIFELTGNLNVARCGHTATLLADGKVLVVGGGDDRPLASAEIYDPHTERSSFVGEMSVPRQGHTATLLTDGNVLIVGGTRDTDHGAELFNAKTMRFESTDLPAFNRLAHTATLLSDGRVLVVGGAVNEERGHKVSKRAELYDPKKREFAATGNMATARYKHGAALLPDGSVFIIGGSDERDWQGQHRSAELFDPKKGTFTRIGDARAKRFKLPGAITLLEDGSTLIAGGSNYIERFDWKSRAFSTVAELEEPNFYSTVTLLTDGTVLIAGAYNTQPQSTDKAWLYRH